MDSLIKKKRITRKKFVLKSEKLCGTVVKANDLIVICLYDNGRRRIYTREQFDELCEIIDEKPVNEDKKYPITITTDFNRKVDGIIKKYLNTKFARHIIEFNKSNLSKQWVRVRIDGVSCGAIKNVRKTFCIRFKASVPPPVLSEYLISAKNGVCTYKFYDLSPHTRDCIRISINYMLLNGIDLCKR